MSVDQYAHQELVHIGRMIAELARVATSGRCVPAHPVVMRPEYWRRRIDALIDATANEPLRRDAVALRERLATVCAAVARPVTGDGDKAARETSREE
ncbi:hypothetical protein QCE63_30445 [Caballeronia sp. LZ065]|uniref:hypothetical protein n=1 Tax=Caballeronia sp. LZ065 TaxID=3038571 RepID=UPI002857FFDB|nr:hypothetical protein [Caballeronia sp. LZ065]MDR5783739.1 hypothetical protein [Caballeronia sp. LZ065]